MSLNDDLMLKLALCSPWAAAQQIHDFVPAPGEEEFATFTGTAAANTTGEISSIECPDLPQSAIGLAVIVNGARYFIPAIPEAEWNATLSSASANALGQRLHRLFLGDLQARLRQPRASVPRLRPALHHRPHRPSVRLPA